MWIIFVVYGFLRVVCAVNGYDDESGNVSSSSDYSTDYQMNTVEEDMDDPYLERSSVAPSSRRAGSFYKRRPYTNPMPECAAQQVCNAVFMRLKFVQPLCRCASAMKSPCSTRMNPNDGHTINLLADKDGQKTQTLVKVCEDVHTVKMCNEPHDWMLLALQNVRTGKAHYLVVCKCPSHGVMEGPVLHTQPPYARIPGISVYGMLCIQGRKSRLQNNGLPPVPWDKILEVYNSTMISRNDRSRRSLRVPSKTKVLEHKARKLLLSES